MADTMMAGNSMVAVFIVAGVGWSRLVSVDVYTSAVKPEVMMICV